MAFWPSGWAGAGGAAVSWWLSWVGGQPDRRGRFPGAGGGALAAGGGKPLGGDHHGGGRLLERLAGWWTWGPPSIWPRCSWRPWLLVLVQNADRGAGPARGGLLDLSAPAGPHHRTARGSAGPGGPRPPLTTPRAPAGGEHWCAWAAGDATRVLLLAATATAAVPGISAAGATPASPGAPRRPPMRSCCCWALGPRPHALPPLPAGVSPALISRVVVEQLGLLERLGGGSGLRGGAGGAASAPAGLEGAGPARCLSTGQALPPQRVQALLERGRRWGERWRPTAPLLLAECVPGGTTTALGGAAGPGGGGGWAGERQPARARPCPQG